MLLLASNLVALMITSLSCPDLISIPFLEVKGYLSFPSITTWNPRKLSEMDPAEILSVWASRINCNPSSRPGYILGTIFLALYKHIKKLIKQYQYFSPKIYNDDKNYNHLTKLLLYLLENCIRSKLISLSRICSSEEIFLYMVLLNISSAFS